jgi:hypothetical protein
MMKMKETQVQEVLQTPAAEEWQSRLTAAFLDAKAKRQVIQEIRSGVAALLPSAGPEQLERLQGAVVARLVAEASRDAKPSRPDKPAETLLSGADLVLRVTRGYPYPIANAYRAFTQQESPTASFGSLLATFESLTHFLASVAVSAYCRSHRPVPACDRFLLEQLRKDKWSTGDLLGLLRETLRLAGDCSRTLPYADLPRHLVTAEGKLTPSYATLDSFVTLRNRCWGHVGGRTDEFYEPLVEPNRNRLDAELSRMFWLEGWQLIRPVQIQETGQVTAADLLTGDLRLRDQRYELRLAVEDLDWHGGDVRARKSLLLVSPDRQRYLPIFPLSLFGVKVQAPGQGVYFLQRPEWHRSESGQRLRRVFYVAYEPNLGEHEERAGDLAVTLLERIVSRLEPGGDVLGDAGRPFLAAVEDPSCELPAVRDEQEFHLRTFVGRDALLGEIGHWIEQKVEGGYLLILGPPGQGKSALMAALAQREQKGRLLHMVKSHRDPLKFVPALISQAARITRRRFGSAAYEGGIDDLRNTLLRALEALLETAGRAVVIIDALDEMEASRERLAFLPPALPSGVRVVLTCRPDIPLVRAMHARLSNLEEKELLPLSETDLPQFLERCPEAGILRTLEDTVDWRGLFQQMQGNPLFLHRALDRITRLAAEARQRGKPLEIDWRTLPASLDALFEDIYGEITERHQDGGPSERGRRKGRLLQLLCLAREPLYLEQWNDLLAADGVNLSLEGCRDLVFEMSQYLLHTADDRFKPWHQGLLDFVRGQLLGARGSRQVEEVYCTWLRGLPSPHEPYSLRHRTRHLLAVQQFDELSALLTDLDYLEAKAEAGLIFELAADLAETLHRIPFHHPRRGFLEMIEETLRTDIHFLTRHPASLFQCL